MQRPVEVAADEVDVLEQQAEALQGRSYSHWIGMRTSLAATKSVDGEQAQTGRAVDEDVVASCRQPPEASDGLRDPALPGCRRPARSRRPRGRSSTGHGREFSTSGHGWTTSAIRTPSATTSYTLASLGVMVDPSAVLALSWGSRSTTRTRRPPRARAAARFTAVVVCAHPALLVGDGEDARVKRGGDARCRSGRRCAARSAAAAGRARVSPSSGSASMSAEPPGATRAGPLRPLGVVRLPRRLQGRRPQEPTGRSPGPTLA